MSSILKRIPLKNFNLEKLQETLDNSFCELMYTDALFEILRKANNENIFVYECIG